MKSEFSYVGRKTAKENRESKLSRVRRELKFEGEINDCRKYVQVLIFLFFIFTEPEMSVNLSSMFQQLAAIAKDKPLKKANDLTIGQFYNIHGITRPEGGFDSLLLESDDFVIFLPKQYSKVETLDEIRLKDDYKFTVDQIFITRNGLFSSKLSFYKGMVKLN